MPDSHLGFSIFLENFHQQKSWLSQFNEPGTIVFTSLQRQQEWSPTYAEDVEAMLTWLGVQGFYIIADVSPLTLEWLSCDSLQDLIDRYGIHNLRIDDGFSPDDLYTLKNCDLTLNASTQIKGLDQWLDLRDQNQLRLFAMHNYYPRPETGLDPDQLKRINDRYAAANIPVIGFICGDGPKRGPLYQGLPTIEACRNLLPGFSFGVLNCLGCDYIIVSETYLSDQALVSIQEFQRHHQVDLPCILHKSYQNLNGLLINIRPDCPQNILRSSVLRGNLGASQLEPQNVQDRQPGDITLDNTLYGPYAGELQILNCNLSLDPKVNIIGRTNYPLPLVFLLASQCVNLRMVVGELETETY